MFCSNNNWNNLFKMNKTTNKFFSAGDKFMVELHLRQLEFTYSVCRSFTKHCEYNKKFRETVDLR